MAIPSATYRLQINADFTLKDARAIVPYLHDLGVTHLYLSPIFRARAGSTHGYDVIDPTRVSEEIGGDAALRALAADAHTRGMAILLDIVPNHMAASPENPWWDQLLLHGIDAPAACHFDLEWSTDPRETRLLLPLLGSDPEQCIERGEFRVRVAETGFRLIYDGNALPLAPSSFTIVLDAVALDSGTTEDRVLTDLADGFRSLPAPPGVRGTADGRRYRATCAALDAFAGHFRASSLLRERLQTAARRFNRLEPEPTRRSAWRNLLRRQNYVLASWRVSLTSVGYRRFFDITDLVGVRVEDPEVFDDTHRLVARLLANGVIDGLRIDHVDGLADPAGYLHRLTRLIEENPGDRKETYLVVEKILAPGEGTPGGWPVDGTTGYDFLNVLNGWYVDPEGYVALIRGYEAFTGRNVDLDTLIRASKRAIIDRLFGGELAYLAGRLEGLAAALGAAAAQPVLATAIAAVASCLAVYRTYLDGSGIRATDRARITAALGAARRGANGDDRMGIDLLHRVLLLDVPPDLRPAALRFAMAWQQFTAPVMAKGLEDTALYVCAVLASVNEVGSHPGNATTSTAELHAWLAERQERQPLALNAGSTHDTKRAEDVRARINVLSELAAEWLASLPQDAAAEPGRPSPADMYLLRQTVAGTWPAGGPGPDYAARLKRYMSKAAREAKVETTWLDPCETYESALSRAVDALLEATPSRAAAAPVDAARSPNARTVIEAKPPDPVFDIAHRIALPGVLNSLSQLLVRITAPGIPDLYRGTEQWAFDLVDPDNRRPVDFQSRAHGFADLEPLLAAPAPESVRDLLLDWRTGAIKQFVTAAALRFRRARRRLFRDGAYIPLNIAGPRAEHVLAFARRHGDEWVITVASRWFARLGIVERIPDGSLWAGTALNLPVAAPIAWRDALTGRRHEALDQRLALEELLDAVPLALLEAAPAARLTAAGAPPCAPPRSRP